MQAPSSGDRVLRFGLCEVNLTARCLTCGSIPKKLQPKDWLALELLLLNRGQLISYEQFKNVLWPDVNVAVRAGVHTRISNLNRAFGNSDYIENVTDQGYRFRASVPVEDFIVSATLLSDPSVPLTAIESQLPSPPPLPARPAAKKPLLPVTVLLLTLLLIGGFATRVFFLPPPIPVSCLSEGRLLTTLDDRQRPVWSYTLPSIAAPSQPVGADWQMQREWFADLDGDGRPELLYVHRPLNPAPSGSRTLLYCFSSKGQLLWTFRAGRTVHTPAGREFGGDYHVNAIRVLKQPRPDGGLIVIGSFHNFSWPYQIQLLTAQGKQVAEYWHPGWLWKMDLADLDGDGFEEILLGGVNNSYGEIQEDGLDYGPTLVVLDSRKVFGMGPVTGKDDRVVTGIPPADESAVLLFRSPIEFSDQGSFHRVRRFHISADRHLTVLVGSSAEHPQADLPSPTVWFDLTPDLRLGGLQPELNLQAQFLRSLPKSLPEPQRLPAIRQRFGRIKYLKNRWAR